MAQHIPKLMLGKVYIMETIFESIARRIKDAEEADNANSTSWIKAGKETMRVAKEIREEHFKREGIKVS